MYAFDLITVGQGTVQQIEREVRRLCLGDALYAHPVRLERVKPDRGLEYYLLSDCQSALWKAEVRSPLRLPAIQRRIAEALALRGISHWDTWLILGGALHRTTPLYRVPRLRI